eukprot:TCONS_00019154-protein
MLKKIDALRSSKTHESHSNLVKKNQGAASPSLKSGTSYSGFLRQQQQQKRDQHRGHQQAYEHIYQQPLNPKQFLNREITSSEISESYVNSQNLGWRQQPHPQQPSSAPSSTKGVRKFTPAFFLRKKKSPEAQIEHGVETRDIDSEEDETDIARFEDFEQESINRVYLGQLDDSQLNTVEEEGPPPYDKMYQRRLEYILSHYERPPPYPGFKNEKKFKQAEQISSRLDQNTPLLKQLLNDNQLSDNSSMMNFMQTGPTDSHRIPSQHHPKQNQNDKLVLRTQNNPSIKTENSKDLYDKRTQHYLTKINEIEHEHSNTVSRQIPDRDAISEIIYPAKDYELHHLERPPNQMHMSASVPDLSMNNTKSIENTKFSKTSRKPRDRIEPGELEALIVHLRKTSLDTFEPYGMKSESISLYSSEDSSSYVPPSPYMSEEIPDWLQFYAKASPDHDEYLKWTMFRYTQLDCWQTMLKRLYKKELEQVVLWFEEYRSALSDELDRQEEIMHHQQQYQQQQRQYQFNLQKQNEQQRLQKRLHPENQHQNHLQQREQQKYQQSQQLQTTSGWKSTETQHQYPPQQRSNQAATHHQQRLQLFESHHQQRPQKHHEQQQQINQMGQHLELYQQHHLNQQQYPQQPSLLQQRQMLQRNAKSLTNLAHLESQGVSSTRLFETIDLLGDNLKKTNV